MFRDISNLHGVHRANSKTPHEKDVQYTATYGGEAAYQLGNTSSRTITEVKQC